MLKLAVSFLAAGVAILILIGITGHLVWDNKLLWAPLVFFGFAATTGFTGVDHEEHRGALLLLGALSLCCILGYAVFYFFLFGLGGR
jgi:hypothetical protein